MTRFAAQLFRALALVLLVATPAFAQEAPPSEQALAQAREAYSQGQERFREGDFAGALASFESAHAAVPNPVVLLSIAECQVRLGQYTAAVVTLGKYLDARPDAPDRPQVEAQIAKLRERPALITIESTPSGAAITVDGVETGLVTPADLELTSGDHVVALTLAGFEPVRHELSVLIGARDTLSFPLEQAAPEAPVPAVASSTPTDAEVSDQRRTRTAVWVATGIAGAGLATGALLGGLAMKQRNDFDDAPTESKADKGERLALFADVGFGVAAAAGVTALVLLFTDGASADAEADTASARLRVAPALSAQSAGIVGAVDF